MLVCFVIFTSALFDITCVSFLVDAVAFTVALNNSYSSSQIPFNSVIYDNRGSYRSTNQSFTAQESGLYVIGLTGEQTGGQYSDLGIQINRNTGTGLNVSVIIYILVSL